MKAGQRNLTQRKIYQQHNRHSQKSNWKDIKYTEKCYINTVGFNERTTDERE